MRRRTEQSPGRAEKPEGIPAVVVAAALVRNGRVLAQQRAYPPELAGRWELPGGRVEPQESARQALVRECREELAVEVVPGEQLGSDVQLSDGYVLRVHVARLAQPTATPVPVEHEALRWVEVGDLATLNWLDADRAILPDLEVLLRDHTCGAVGGAGAPKYPPSNIGLPGIHSRSSCVPTVAPARLRTDLRNVAIVAHVDHGKTTLVDAMLRQSGAVAGRTEVDRVLDSGDLEREKGITILAKNTAVTRSTPDGPVTINVVDTPGHADFGGEVERGLSMVDGVLLLVDASEGPLPQTRFVLRKALAAHLPVVLVVNKVDRPDARIVTVVEETHDLLLDLASDLEGLEADTAAAVLDLPVIYASARAGRASLNRPRDGELPDADDLTPLFDVILTHVPPPAGDEQAPLQAHVTNLDASTFLGRIALCRVRAGRLHKGQTVAWCREDGTIRPVRITELLRTEGLDRVPATSAKAGDLIAIAGIAEITIGDTLADLDDPRPLPRITVDEPVIAMTIGINTSPLAGRGGGRKLTARLVRNRLDAELVGNVSIRVSPTESPDTWEVQGRGELALAILVETMRREGFELTIGKPQVVTRTVDGTLHEPFEHLTVDVPEEYVGPVTQLLASRKGRTEQLGATSGDGWVRLEFTVPSRGLIGFRTEFLTITRGTGVVHHVFDGYRPWVGELRTRRSGSLVADRSGAVTGYALTQLGDRGAFFVEPGAAVYAGMVVGENPRAEDLDLNICRERKLTNVRSSSGEELERLARPRTLGLEEALEFCASDECVEVAPDVVRVRKVVLDATQRGRQRARDRVVRGPSTSA